MTQDTKDRRQYHREWMRKKRATDPEFRKRQNEATGKYLEKRRAEDPEFREQRNEASRKRLKERRVDPEFRKREKECRQKRRAFVRLHFPWMFHWEAALRRCNDPRVINYKWYGGKGVRMLLSKEETRILYIRDRAWEMRKPSIDRTDPSGDYCLENCRFIERSENSRDGALRACN